MNLKCENLLHTNEDFQQILNKPTIKPNFWVVNYLMATFSICLINCFEFSGKYIPLCANYYTIFIYNSYILISRFQQHQASSKNVYYRLRFHPERLSSSLSQNDLPELYFRDRFSTRMRTVRDKLTRLCVDCTLSARYGRKVTNSQEINGSFYGWMICYQIVYRNIWDKN